MTIPFKYVPIGSKSEYSWLGATVANPNYVPNYGLFPTDIGYDIKKRYQFLPQNLDISKDEYYSTFVPKVNPSTSIPAFNLVSTRIVDDAQTVLANKQWQNVAAIPQNIEITVAYVGGALQGGETFIGGGAYKNKYVIFFAETIVSYDTHNLSLGTWGGWLAMHELGHVLGLSHGNNSSLPESNQINDLRSSIMWYPTSFTTTKIPLTPGMQDIYDLQFGNATKGIAALGLSATSNGNDAYVFTQTLGPTIVGSVKLGTLGSVINIDPAKAVMTIWDSGGSDTINASLVNSDTYINLNAGTFSSIGSNIFLAPSTGLGDTKYNVGIAIGASIENATGGSARDNLQGNVLANLLDGGAGNDWIYGYDGNDTLNGGAGNDLITGGKGNDLINGGLGTDSFFGLEGADKFVFDFFNSNNVDNDTINDFNRTDGDKIDLSLIDANILVAGNQAFSFFGLGTLATGSVGRLIVQASNNGVPGNTLYGYTNGDAIADFHIVLTGITSTLSTDIIL